MQANVETVDLETRLVQLIQAHNHRPLLEITIEAGAILIRLKAGPEGRHGRWLPNLKRWGLKPRTAQEWMQVARNAQIRGVPRISEHVSQSQYVSLLRNAKKETKRAELLAIRKAAAKCGARLPDDKSYCVVHADARKYAWPKAIDLVSSDPSWRDLEAYAWLARFCADHLRNGGLALIQCGQSNMPKIVATCVEAGLTYRWTMAIVFDEVHSEKTMLHPFCSNWRPVLVFSRGAFRRKACPVLSDVFTVRTAEKHYHDWQQPLKPWCYWINRLAAPGSLVVDPFAGSATIGVAVKMSGEGRRYLGTEIDPTNAAICRDRLAKTVEGSFYDEMAKKTKKPEMLTTIEVPIRSFINHMGNWVTVAPMSD